MIKIVDRLDPLPWREFVESHPQGNVFHTPEMFQVFERACDYHPSLWAAIRNSGQILAILLPVQITLAGWILSFFTTRAVSYGGLLFEHSAAGQEAVSLLLRTYKQQVSDRPLFTELRNLSDMGEIRAALQRNGFIFEDHLNYLLDIRHDPETIFRGFDKRLRHHLRRNLHRGEVAIEDIRDRAQLNAFYDVLSMTYQSARMPLADLELFQAAFDILMPKGMIRFTLAKVGDKPASAAVVLLYKGVVYGWYNGTNRAYRSHRTNDLLVWETIKWGAEHGYSIFDFGGAGKPDEKYGVRDFKAKFGGELVNYGRNICVHARWRRMISAYVYRLARNALLFVDQIYPRLLDRKSPSENISDSAGTL